MKESTPHDSEKEPRTWYYLFAWCLAALLSNVALWLIGTTLPETTSRYSEYASLIVIYCLEISIVVAIWIAVYSLFVRLDICKVVPWMWGLSIVGILLRFTETILVKNAEFDFDLNSALIQFAFEAFSLVIVIVAFTGFFKWRGRYRAITLD